MRTVFAAVIAGVAAGALLTAQSRTPAEKAYDEAVYVEQVKGDLKRAVEMFEQIVKQFPSEKDVVARTQQRLGAARMTLAGQKAVPNTGETPTARLVLRGTSRNSPVDSAISLDGRWLAMGGPSTTEGVLIVRELATGRVTRLPTGACIQGPLGCFAYWPVFSPDGRQIAYGWTDQLAPNGTDEELRVIANEPGANARTLLRDPKVDVGPLDWAPDGRSILASIWQRDSGTQLAWVSVANGRYRIVESLAFRRPGAFSRPRVSPDGRFIVYTATAGPSDLNARLIETQIYVVAADGSSEAQLTAEGINEGPVWTPDGSHVVFVSNRSGSFALWAAPVRNGEPSGPAVLVRRDTGRIMSIGMARSGSYYYVREESSGDGQNMFEFEIDPTTGKAKGTRKDVSERFVGLNCCAVWSPDGKSVAFKRKRPENQNIRDLVVRYEETKAERTYTAPEWVNVPYGFGPGAPKWLADGSGFFIGDEPIVGQPRWLGRMTLDGQFTRLVQIPAELGWVASLSPDNKTAYVLTRKGNPQRGTYAGVASVNLSTGTFSRLFETKDGRLSSVHASPDERTLALFVTVDAGGRDTSAIATMAVDGSNYREIYVTRERIATVPDQVQWSRDGRSLFFQEAGRFMRISSQGGTPEYWASRAQGRIRITDSG